MQSQAIADSRRQSELVASSRMQLQPVAGVRSGILVGRRQSQPIAHSQGQPLCGRYKSQTVTTCVFPNVRTAAVNMLVKCEACSVCHMVHIASRCCQHELQRQTYHLELPPYFRPQFWQPVRDHVFRFEVSKIWPASKDPRQSQAVAGSHRQSQALASHRR